MTWLQKFKLREYVRESLWIIPLAFAFGAVVLALVAEEIDRATEWQLFDFSAGAAGSVLGTITGSMITFTGFVFSTVMVALQFASGQISPRVLKSAFREPRTKVSLGVFIATFMFTLIAQADLNSERVPQLTVTIAILLVIASVVVFLSMLHELSQTMRAANMVAAVGETTRSSIELMYPELAGEHPEPVPTHVMDPADAVQVVRHDGQGGVIQAYDTDGLIALAREHEAVVEIAPGTGDFVPYGSALFRIYGNEIPEAELRCRIALGAERTLVQDPAFGMRIIVDAGAKALSPGVNDPTTAVVALDQIHDLLQFLGTRRLRTGEHRDLRGDLRLVENQPTWPDYVSLGIDEIRMFGEGTVQVARRLRAVIADLLQEVPAARRPPLEEQLELLDASVERGFADELDRQHASFADHQGVGGTRRTVHHDEGREPALV